jgi:hypothetical protein
MWPWLCRTRLARCPVMRTVSADHEARPDPAGRAGSRARGDRRMRGPNKATAWRRDPDADVAVIRLALDVTDLALRRRVEQLFAAAYSVKRAVVGDGRARLAAYRAAHRQRSRVGGAAVRDRLALSRPGLERAAYRHLDAAGHLRHHLTKALAMHLADEAWPPVARHLFGDARGRRGGAPKPGRWWDFRRLPGRARSHTRARKWETFRLHGSLAGHLAAYRHHDLPAATTLADVAALAPGTSVLAQPARLPTPTPTPRAGRADWWAHDGALVVVLTGPALGELAMPVRLPQGAGRFPYLAHYLEDPDRWHKVDLVRCQDPAAPGGWRYEAHLMVLGPGYASPATVARRVRVAALSRRGGVDANVSNLAAVSFPTTDPGATSGLAPTSDAGRVAATRLTLSPAERRAAATAAVKARRRNRALDRSRRSANPTRYRPSIRQAARARRRDSAGLPARREHLPGGARHTRADGRPTHPYRADTLTRTYRRLRAAHAAAGAAHTRARADRARRAAAAITTTHGAHLVVEHCNITAWFRLWGKATALFTPGMLVAALARECAAAGGQLRRASTRTTALSQHCLCGHRQPKPLSQRRHHCPVCGLRGDRDLVAAAVAAFVEHTDPTDPSTATVNTQACRHALRVHGQGLQEALSESTVTPPRPRHPGAATGRTRQPPTGGPCSAKRRRPHATHPRTRPAAAPPTARPRQDGASQPRHGP